MEPCMKLAEMVLVCETSPMNTVWCEWPPKSLTSCKPASADEKQPCNYTEAWSVRRYQNAQNHNSQED